MQLTMCTIYKTFADLAQCITISAHLHSSEKRLHSATVSRLLGASKDNIFINVGREEEKEALGVHRVENCKPKLTLGA